MERFFLVLTIICLLPLAAFLGYSQDLSAPLSLGQDPGMGGHWNIRAEEGTEITQHIDTAGISSIRIGFRWQLIEKDQDGDGVADNDWNFNAQFIKDQVQTARALGMTPVALLDGKPVFLEDCGRPGLEDQGACAPDDDEWGQYREFLSAIHSEFDSIVDHWELWNETFSDGTQTSHSRGLLFNRSPRALDSIVKIAFDTLGGPGEIIACCGFKDEGTVWDFTTNVGTDSVDDRTDQNWIATFGKRWENELDAITLHHYDSVQGGFIEQETDEIIDDLTAAGAPQQVWVTEFGIGCRNLTENPEDVDCTDAQLEDEASPIEIAQTIQRVRGSMDEESRWTLSHYFLLGRHSNWREILYIDTANLDGTLDSINYEPYCDFVNRAGNLSIQGTCLKDVSLSGPTDVLNGETCSYTASVSGGSGSYLYDWTENGVNKTTTSDTHTMSYSDTIIDLAVKVNDQAGGVAVRDTLNVTFSSNGMMCVT